MNRARKEITPDQAQAVKETAESVAARRRALGLTQVQLDQDCGFTSPIVYAIERGAVNERRSLATDDWRVLKVLATLARIEADPDWKSARCGPPHRSRTSPRALRTRPKPAPHSESQTLHAVLKRCPDQDLWITQAGCESMLKTHAICRARRLGLGCKGIAHRYFHKGKRIERKEIAVQYTPPKPAESDSNRLRFEDWT